MKNFVEVEWLKENFNNVTIIDVRYDLQDKPWGEKTYNESHIEGAYYLDLDKDLAGEKKLHGGSRPVPNTKEFAAKLEKMGITADTHIVIYDKNMITGARAFWMLRYLGHTKISILNGGWDAWVAANGATTSDLTPAKESEYKVNIQERLFCDIEEVKNLKANQVLIESRSLDRYLGQNENMYAKAGHIPGAICIDSKSLIANGKIKSTNELKEIMARVEEDKEAIFYCGSGINASLDFVAYDETGREGRLYVGSFSDWISYEENSIETKDEN